MLKALLKKQLLEVNSFYFMDRKTGKRRSKEKTLGMVAVYLLVFVSLGATFFGVGRMLAGALMPMGLGWLYFALMGALSVFLGVFGGVFNAGSALYHAKDNDSLLAMPIRPAYILAVRLLGVYLMGLLYEAFVFVPTVLAYFIFGSPTGLGVINAILLIPVLGLLVLVLTCVLGWVVAVIASKLRNKSFVTVILSLGLIAVYYFFCGNYYQAAQSIIENADRIGITVKNAVWPMYMMGCGAMGDPVGMLVFLALNLILAALVFFVLSKSFVKIATGGNSAPKVEYREKAAKVSGVDKALLRREWKHFTASPVYMLNCGIGTVFLVIAAVAAFVTRERITETVASLAGYMSHDTILLLAAAGCCVLATMNDITAPSISLEGKTLWLVQSLPVEPAKVLNAKQKLHWYLTVPPVVLMSASLSYVLGADFTTAVFSAGLAIAFVQFSAAGGLIINLLRPNLTWTTETAPVKQSAGVLIAIFGGWVVALVLAAVGYLALKFTSLQTVLIGGLVILVLATRLLNRWLGTKGAKIFAEL